MPAIAEFPDVERHASTLTYDQVYHFMEEGYVHVRGLIPPEVAARADEAAYRVVGLDPADPETWSKAKHSTFSEDPDLMAMYTRKMLNAAGQLASVDPHLFPTSRVPQNAYILTVVPRPQAWAVDKPHIDGSGGWQAPVLSFPRPWVMFAMLYLHDVEHHAGATIVFPKSHRKFQALLRSEPERYRFMAQMNDDFKRVDIGEPVEVPVQAGDVLFLDQMTVHAGSLNCGKRPRS